MRSVGTCIVCKRDNVPIVAHGLCGRCHLQWWRKAQAEHAAETPVGTPRPDASQRHYQTQLSEQIIRLSKCRMELESKPILATALPAEVLADIITKLSQAILTLNVAKDHPGIEEKFSENPENEFSENSAPIAPPDNPEKFSENLPTEFSENSLPKGKGKGNGRRKR